MYSASSHCPYETLERDAVYTDVNIKDWQSIPWFEGEIIQTKEVTCLVCLRMELAGRREDGLHNSTHQTSLNSEAQYHIQYPLQASSVQCLPLSPYQPVRS